MLQFESYSIQVWGRGGAGANSTWVGPLHSRPKRLRDYYWLITVAGMLKKMKITFWPSLLPLSIAALNHFSTDRAARVFIYGTLFWGTRCSCLVVYDVNIAHISFIHRKCTFIARVIWSWIHPSLSGKKIDVIGQIFNVSGVKCKIWKMHFSFQYGCKYFLRFQNN